MIKILATDMMGVRLSMRTLVAIRKLIKELKSLGSICMFSEDLIYKWRFWRNDLPEIYRFHVTDLQANCVFCANLVRSDCHRHCLKCSSGTYIHCSPLLPGLLLHDDNFSTNMNQLKIPWYFRKPCSNFKRLPQKNYLKNFNIAFSSIGIYNIEVLEGLEKGLSSGEKPCHVCASINYELYKKCSGQEDFETKTPCQKIVSELAGIYQQQASN